MKAKEFFLKGVGKIKNFRLTRKVFAYPYVLFMLIFVLAPLVILLVNAFLDANQNFTFDNFKSFFTDSANVRVLMLSLVVGLITTVLCLVIGYPVAYILSKWSSGSIIVLLIILPMWVNFLIRTYALKAIFALLDTTLGWGTVIIGMVYNFIPYMIMPLHTTLTNIDPSYAEAAKDLGADGVQTFLKSTLPLSLPGIISGITMVFIPTISAFAISGMLSNNTKEMVGDTINTMFTNQLYGVGSVMSLIMLVFVLILNFFMNKANKGEAQKNLW